MSLSKKLSSGLSWQVLNVVSRAVIQLIFVSTLARLVSKEAFGLIALSNVVVGFIDVFSQIGIGPAIVQRKNLEQNHINTAFISSIFLGVFFCLLLIFLSPFLAEYFENLDLRIVLLVISSSFIISGFGVVPRSLLMRRMGFEHFFKISIVAMLVGNICVGLILAILDFEVWAMVFALLIQNFIMSIGMFIVKKESIQLKFNLVSFKELFSMGSGMTLLSLFNYFGQQIDKLIVGKIGSISTLGIYERSIFLMNIPVTLLGNVFDHLLFSGFSKVQDDLKNARKMYLSGISFVALAIFPLSAFSWVFADEVVLIFLGEKWMETVPVLKILILVLGFRSLIKINDPLVKGLGAVFQSSVIKFIFLITTFTACYYGMQKMDLLGVAIGFSSSIVLQFVLMTLLCIKLLKMDLIDYIKGVFPALLFAFLVLGLSYYLKMSIALLFQVKLLVMLFSLIIILMILMGLVIWKPSVIGQSNMETVVKFMDNLPTKWRLLNNIKRKINKRIG